MSLKNIKLIVADLDGTLLHDDKSLDRNIKSVLIEKNVPLTFCIGSKCAYYSGLYKKIKYYFTLYYE